MKVISLNLKPSFIPEQSSVKCEGVLDIEYSSENPLIVMLNEELQWQSIKLVDGNSIIALNYAESSEERDSFLSVGKKWQINLPEDFDKSTFSLHVSYSGTIKSDPYDTNYLTPNAIELACYACWYPIISIEDHPSYTVEIDGPEDWVWVVNGQAKDSSNTSWENPRGDTDITLVGLPGTKAIQPEDSSLFFGSLSHYDDFKKIEPDLELFQGKLIEWFGPPKSGTLTIALVDREKGGIYVRDRLIVSQSVLPQEYFNDLKPLLVFSWVHELSHMWLHGASVSSYHNWIDEALADYTAVLLTEEEYGEEFFKTRIEKIRETVKNTENLQSIVETARADSNANVVYYKWGSLIIHDIREKIGRDKLKEAIYLYTEAVRVKGLTTTDDFVEALNSATDGDWNQYMDKKLSETPHI